MRDLRARRLEKEKKGMEEKEGMWKEKTIQLAAIVQLIEMSLQVSFVR